MYPVQFTPSSPSLMTSWRELPPVFICSSRQAFHCLRCACIAAIVLYFDEAFFCAPFSNELSNTALSSDKHGWQIYCLQASMCAKRRSKGEDAQCG